MCHFIHYVLVFCDLPFSPPIVFVSIFASWVHSHMKHTGLLLTFLGKNLFISSSIFTSTCSLLLSLSLAFCLIFNSNASIKSWLLFGVGFFGYLLLCSEVGINATAFFGGRVSRKFNHTPIRLGFRFCRGLDLSHLKCSCSSVVCLVACLT